MLDHPSAPTATPLTVIFCADPLAPRRVDPFFADELAAATAAGCRCALLDFEALVDDDDAVRAIRRIDASPLPALACYRGWMLKPAQYRRLYDALAARGVTLLNDPSAYRLCHYLPEAYPFLAGQTPCTVWLTLDREQDAAPPFATIMALLAPFGNRPVIVKDFVKSRKHEWDEACFIPSATDPAAVERVVRRFLELQGADLNEGLVFREFVPLDTSAGVPDSGPPQAREYRLFVLDGVPLYGAPQDAADADVLMPPLDQFETVMRRLRSRFFTLDLARDRVGRWLIIETGDGQVSGLPAAADPERFYRALGDHFRTAGA